MLTMSLLIVGLPLAAMLVAAWPLLFLPRVRTALACSGGTCCVAGGTTLLGLLASGVIALPGTSAAASAQDSLSVPKLVSPPNAPGSATTIEYVSCAAQDATSTPASEDASAAPVAPPAAAPAPLEVAPAAPAASEEIKIETRPDGTVIIPAGRPQWVIDGKPKLVGNIRTIPVSSEPRALPRLAKQALDEALVKATNQYIADHLGSQLAPALVSNYDAAAIKRDFVKPQNFYDEVITVSIGDMHQSHALLEFPPEFNARIEHSWAEVRAASRLTQMGLFVGAGLLLLGAVFGYFRLDNATRGYYTGRLQFMTAAAILAIVGAGIFVARWIHWM
jgi:hypothetical protein